MGEIVTDKQDVSPSVNIKCGQAYGFNVPLKLDKNTVITIKNDKDFSNELQMVIGTNLFSIDCSIQLPIYLLFDPEESMTRDEFATAWRSFNQENECKLTMTQCKYKDMVKLKGALSTGIYELFFIHHRNIQNKGNILYWSCRINGETIAIETAIHISGKGTVITRSDDSHRAKLTAHA